MAFRERDVSTGEWVAIKYIPLLNVRAPGWLSSARVPPRRD
jgi:hypothetical protein